MTANKPARELVQHAIEITRQPKTKQEDIRAGQGAKGDTPGKVRVLSNYLVSRFFFSVNTYS